MVLDELHPERLVDEQAGEHQQRRAGNIEQQRHRRAVAEMREMNQRDTAQLAFPAQNSVTGRLRAAAAKTGNPEFLALWAGQGLAMSRALPAAELIAQLEAEAIEAIRRTTELLKE